MNPSVRLYLILAGIACCVVTLCLSTSVGQDRRTYETQTQVYGISAGRSDTARAIDAYDTLMQRYMDMTERNFSGLAGNLDALAHRLEMIDARLASLDDRLARIEEHLGIKAVAPVSDPNAPPVPPSPAVNTSPLPTLSPQQR